MSNGKINGRVVTFDKEGQVLNDNIYEMGKPTGIIKQYKNGKIISRSHYQNGKQDWFIFYNEDGSIRDSIHYDNTGKRTNPKTTK